MPNLSDIHVSVVARRIHDEIQRREIKGGL